MLRLLWSFLLALCVTGAMVAQAAKDAPPLTPGGRYDVHGWLIMPFDHVESPVTHDSNNSYGIRAWFSHHVPEFWTDSPHNYQIILEGVIYPDSHIPGQKPLPIPFPLPPANDLEVYQYTFTPPPPFSLNDLLMGTIQKLRGTFYNGSFHSSYERIPQSLVTLDILNLTTVTYLSEYETNGYPNLRYLTYPRGSVKSGSPHFYLSHQIHAQPDFDQQMHGKIEQCSSPSLSELLYRAGASWEIVGTPNTLDHRLRAGDVVQINYVFDGEEESSKKFTCTLTVLEDLSCMVGPGFMDNCDAVSTSNLPRVKTGIMQLNT